MSRQIPHRNWLSLWNLHPAHLNTPVPKDFLRMTAQSLKCLQQKIQMRMKLWCDRSWGYNKWAPSSEFVSSSIPSWQTLTAHAQPFRGARALAFCLKVPLDSLFVWASSEGSGETARMRRLAWTFAARIGDKYQIRLTRSILYTHFFLSLSTEICLLDIQFKKES